MAWNPEDVPPRKHCKRHNTPGHSHFLTFSCHGRRPFLEKDRTRQWLAGAIVAARRRHDFALIAYVFMPEHVHLLIRPHERDYDISRILQSLKIPVARRAKAFLKAHAPNYLSPTDGFHFWQAGGGYDRNIYSAEELWERIHYIHDNPVRRKLVERATDWHWSSAADHARIRNGPVPVDHANLPWIRP